MDLGETVNMTANDEAATSPAPAQAAGAAPLGKAAPNPAQIRQRRIAAKALSAAFGDIVSVLAQSANAKERPLSDLQWLVVPALLTGQYRLGEGYSESRGFSAPAGVVLWASVSDEVDRRLSASPEAPIRLAPQEWKSGDNLWLIEAAGSPRILSPMLKGLAEKEWRGKRVKLCVRGQDGKAVVQEIKGVATAA
jgi:hemolysin-activating ACP:hemolysin acyltransferase